MIISMYQVKVSFENHSIFYCQVLFIINKEKKTFYFSNTESFNNIKRILGTGTFFRMYSVE